MLKIKNLTCKNFLSVGNVTQAVKMDQNGLTLVIGLNLDLGGEGARNGVGKTTIFKAIEYINEFDIISGELGENIQKCINNSDIDLAYQILQDQKIEIPCRKEILV